MKKSILFPIFIITITIIGFITTFSTTELIFLCDNNIVEVSTVDNLEDGINTCLSNDFKYCYNCCLKLRSLEFGMGSALCLTPRPALCYEKCISGD